MWVQAALGFLLLVTSHVQPPHHPVWEDHVLAGYDWSHSPMLVVDPSTGYMLINSSECDGALKTFELTRDRHENPFQDALERKNHPEEFVKRPLKLLSTGKGIHIGDSELRLVSLLGKPSHKTRSGNRQQFLDYTYNAAYFQTTRQKVGNKVRESKEQVDLSETYTFKKGKLIQITFFKGSE